MMKRQLSIKENVPPKKRPSISVSKEKKTDKNNSGTTKPKVLTYEWCTKYPGSTPNVISLSIKPWNLKLVSFNVNGIRAWIKNGGLSYLTEESPDVLGVQETKCSQAKLPPECKPTDYYTKWSSGETEGYAGTGVYSKQKPLNTNTGIDIKKHDKEGRTITVEFEHFYFITAYVPNAGQGLVRLPYRHNEWDPDFLAYLKNLDKNKPIILCGDLNVAHEEIDLANPDSNHRTAGFTDEERGGFTKLLEEVDLVDTYRALYPDRKEAYTFWSYRQLARPKNVGWRLDYFLVSRRLMTNVCDHEIRCGVPGSDHCPIVLYLNV